MSGLIRCYRHSGLRVASGFDLPEWERFRDPRHDAETDATIDWAERPLAPCAVADGEATGTHSSLRFDVAGIGRWLIGDGRRIVVDPIIAPDAPELRLFTLGSAWAALGYQRGWLMCHGGAVMPAGRNGAVLLTGRAGQGKSTLAAAMAKAGGAVLSDDLCRIEVTSDAAMLHPSAGHMKLWRETVHCLGWEDRIAARDHFRSEKFLCRLPAVIDNRAQPLRAVVVLEWGEALSLGQVRGGDAAAKVLAATCYRPQMLDVLGAWTGQTRQVMHLLQHVPAFRLIRPRAFCQLDAACRLLSELAG